MTTDGDDLVTSKGKTAWQLTSVTLRASATQLVARAPQLPPYTTNIGTAIHSAVTRISATKPEKTFPLTLWYMSCLM
jgi:hypothetical protein